MIIRNPDGSEYPAIPLAEAQTRPVNDASDLYCVYRLPDARFFLTYEGPTLDVETGDPGTIHKDTTCSTVEELVEAIKFGRAAIDGVDQILLEQLAKTLPNVRELMEGEGDGDA